MKQHDLLVLLCEAYPNVFVITISFADKLVYINAKNPSWEKVIPYASYVEASIDQLYTEILNEYNAAKTTAAATTEKVFSDEGGA